MRKSPLRAGRRCGQRGAATVELVLATPLLLLLLALGLQGALWIHASHVAKAVTTQAVEATRVDGGTIRQGETTAAALISQLGSDLLLDPQVTVTRGNGVARVEMDATAPVIIPGLRLPIRASAQAPIEQFRPAVGRGQP